MTFRIRSTFILIPFLATILVLLAAGCRGKAAHQYPATDDALVPNADVIVRCNITSLRESPIGKKIEQLKTEREKANPALAEKGDREVKLEKATGLTKEDVTAILMSASLAGINSKDTTAEAVANQLPAALAVELSKPISLDQLRAAAKVITSDTPDTVSEVKLDGVTAVVIKSSNPKEPSAYAAISTDGKTVFLTLNESSLKDALTRHRHGKPASPSPALAAAEKRLPADSQLKVVFIAPDAVRQAIKDQIASKLKDGGASAGMLMGMFKPFENIQNVSIHAGMSTDAVLSLSAELGSAQDAAQVAVLIPMLQGLIPKNPQSGMPDLSTCLSCSNSGAVISVTLRLTEQDIVAANQSAPSSGYAAPRTPRTRTRTSPGIPAPVETPAEVLPPPSAPVVQPTPPTPPPAPAVVTPAPSSTTGPDWSEAKKKVKYSGAIKGKDGKWMAMIDNSLVAEGGIVSVNHEQMTYRWKISAISKNGVTFVPLDKRPQE
jgi:hypothetical protein